MSIFPFIDSTSTSTETNDELPMLKEYAYDFEKNELLHFPPPCRCVLPHPEAARSFRSHKHIPLHLAQKFRIR